MCSDLPEFKTCCCCLPLRFGLIAWGYFKVLISFTVSIFVCGLLMEASIMLERVREEMLPYILFFILIGIVATLDIIMSIMLIVSCKKQNAKLLRTYYTFSKCLVVLSLIWSIYYLSINLLGLFTDNTELFMSAGSFVSGMIISMMYFAGTAVLFLITLLVRSAILELENGEFNNATEL